MAQPRTQQQQSTATAAVALLGIRHHGPGSARAVAAALAAYRPTVVLIEGPPEADALVELAADPEMRPPVALLAHVVDAPGRAAFWPFASFSPEWVALRHALAEGVPVQFIDLPAAHTFALAEHQQAEPAAPLDSPAPTAASAAASAPADADAAADEGETDDGDDASTAPDPSFDPVAVLAHAAGQPDPERWWEDVIEHRAPGADPLAPFTALAEAMAALREGLPPSRSDALREAHMRRAIRAARRAGHERVAVVCGAWHVPALAAAPPVAHDNQLLKGLPKVKVEATWVPWTHQRLAQDSGYGAGIASPGWYQHLHDHRERAVEHWLARVAELLRAEDLSVSSAHVIEAVRLAHTLAALRGRPLPGLDETLDAVRGVMCEGSEVPLALVRDRLVVGQVLGAVPEAAPAVPLQRDLTRSQRALRLKPEGESRLLELDLRKELDADRSRLLHRLALIGVDWGRPARAQRGSTGTFRETWQLEWYPELAVKVAEAGAWGTTVSAAATARVCERAVAAVLLPELTALAEDCLRARLPEALATVTDALADRAALDTDAAHLADALPALVRALRYGDVRGTDTASLGALAESVAARLCVALPPACTGLDADAAAAMAERLPAVHSAVALLAAPAASVAPATDTPAIDTSDVDGGGTGAADGGVRGAWTAALRRITERESAAAVIRGRAARLLRDDGTLTSDQSGRLLGLALSPATPPADAAGWIEGFLSGSGLLLVHDPTLLALLDDWLSTLRADALPALLPLLRRTFATLDPGVRRNVGELVHDGVGVSGREAAEPEPEWDEERAAPALATVRLLLGEGPLTRPNASQAKQN